jgi:putative membrane protein
LRLFGKGEEAYRPESNTEVREHLANERTLLAWVRTGVGLISVGFVVERAGALVAGASGQEGTASEVFGLALVALGCLALVLGAKQFLDNRRMIRQGIFAARTAPYTVIVVGSVSLAIAFIAYALFVGS